MFQKIMNLTAIVRRFAFTGLILASVHICPAPSASAALLRDADIEQQLSDLAAPLLAAANLEPDFVRVLLVNDRSANAFVIDHRAIYINSGLIEKMTTPEMLQAVIAHEAAHIANGHIARRTGNLRNSQTLGALGIALAIATGALSSPEVAGGLALAISNSTWRGFLKHTRAEEAAADQAAANYMRRAGVSPRGLVQIHRLFRGQEALNESRQDPYVRSHPLSRDRIRAAEAFLAQYGDTGEPDPDVMYSFARLKGKLSAFVRNPEWTFQRANEEENIDIRAMRTAIAYHRQSQTDAALRAIDQAISARHGQDGLYFDLKGQLLLESRRFPQALSAYQKAHQLEPDSPQIMGGLGQAQLAVGEFQSAVATLEEARELDRTHTRILRDLGQAYAKVGRIGEASLVTAERYALTGQLRDADVQARRAMDLLPKGSTGWRRAQDVHLTISNNLKRQ
ncbi:MAG: tetratricopeptide repeat protein [Aestuariivita sp.]|nr:tetratricopeptide repeat protein [Aestuariivita sp.]